MMLAISSSGLEADYNVEIVEFLFGSCFLVQNCFEQIEQTNFFIIEFKICAKQTSFSWYYAKEQFGKDNNTQGFERLRKCLLWNFHHK